MKILNITLAILSALTLLGGAAARAGVSTESPFAPRGFGAGVTSNSPIELRGITSDDQGLRFAIYEPAKKEGAWVHIDEQGQPYVIRSYDADTKHITVDYQGRSQTLALADPKFGPGKTVAMPINPVAMQQGQVQQGNINPNDPRAMRQQYRQQQQQQGQGQPGPRNGPQGGQQQAQQQAQPSGAEAARIDAIRAEIVRRRGQRSDAAGNNGGQGQ